MTNDTARVRTPLPSRPIHSRTTIRPRVWRRALDRLAIATVRLRARSFRRALRNAPWSSMRVQDKVATERALKRLAGDLSLALYIVSRDASLLPTTKAAAVAARDLPRPSAPATGGRERRHASQPMYQATLQDSDHDRELDCTTGKGFHG
jgi:hypothetical protein